MFQDQKNSRNSFVVPNIFNKELSEQHNLGSGYGNGNVLLFIGALTYPPNVEGLSWFINSVFKDFKREFNDAKLLVIGRSPTDAVKKLCRGNPAIELHANVPNVKPFYKKCKAVVVPLLAGSGTRIKILEAAMMGRPIFSTPVGASGLDFRDGHEIHLFHNSKEFNSKYIQIDTQDKYSEIVEKAKIIVENNYAKANFKRSFEKVLDYVDSRSK